MKVADVMSKYVDSVSPNTKVNALSLLIFGRGINGVPVCKDRKVVGFVTERDILSKFYPTISEYVEDPFSSANFEGMEGKVREIFEMTTEEIMSPNPTTVTPETPLLRAQSLMFIEKVGRLPVIDKKRNLVGIISKGDIFRALVGDKLLFTENQDYTDWLSKTYYASVDNEDRLSHEIPDILKVFAENKVKTVLDVGCGTGDHMIDLARRGFTTVGIDRSQAMINEASKRRQVLSKEVAERVKFYRGDIDAVRSKLKPPYDAILVIGNTFSHNPHKSDELIRKTEELLSVEGVMVLQITNFEKVLRVQKRLLSFNFAKLKEERSKEYAFLEFYEEPNLREKTILKTFAILVSSGERWKSSGVRNSLLAYSTRDSVKHVLQKNGFSKVSFYGGTFDGKHWDYLFRNPFKPLESDWLNVVATR